MKANTDILNAAKKAGVKLPDIAESLGIEEADLRRWLKYPVPEGTKTMLLNTIAALGRQRKGEMQ